MKVEVNRCPIPMLWLDTSVIIDLTKYRENIKFKEDIQYERTARLNQIIFEKTRSRTLLFVEGDQREEINSLTKEAHGTQSYLTLGIKFQYRKQIHDNQLYCTMKSYLKNEEIVELPYSDAFHRDPIQEIRERDRGPLNGIIISAYMNTSDEEIKDRIARKERLVRELESLRQDRLASGITFEQQVEQEYNGTLHAGLLGMKNLSFKIENGIDITFDDVAQSSVFSEIVEMWARLSRDIRHEKNLTDFLTSAHYRAMPYLDIQSRLYADVITGVKPIQTGDSMDIEHLSTVIPYCNYVMTDLKMKNRIIRLGIDKQYNTKVYCLRDTKELIDDLSKL